MFKGYVYLICAFLSLCFMFFSIQNSWGETNTVSSTVVNNTPPTANAPVLPNSNSDICKVGIGGAVQNNVLGSATGVLVDDELCQLLKVSRSQYAFGMNVAAVAILWQDARVWDSMADAGTPCPVRGFIGAEAEQYWLDHPHEIPEGSRYRKDYIQQVKAEEPQGDMNGLKDFGLMALTMLLLL